MVAKIVFFLGVAIWLIGGNILVAFHYRRSGQSIWIGLKPFRFPFSKFRGGEWLALGALMLASVGLITFALSSDRYVFSGLIQPAPPSR